MDTFGTTNAEAIRNMGVNAEEFINKITEGLSKTTRVQGGIKNAINNAQVAFKQFFCNVPTAPHTQLSAITSAITSPAFCTLNKCR
jgi:hypothetical protein